MSLRWSLNYRVRHGHRGDAKVVLDILLGTLGEYGFPVQRSGVSVDVAEFGLANGNRDEFVAVSCGKVCGFLILGPTPEGGELLEVFVRRAHRGRGIGTMLIARCLQAARERGYREVFLETHTAFAEAREYYPRHGWTQLPHLSVAASPTRMYVRRIVGAQLDAEPASGATSRSSGAA